MSHTLSSRRVSNPARDPITGFTTKGKKVHLPPLETGELLKPDTGGGHTATQSGLTLVELQPEGWPETGTTGNAHAEWTLGRHFLEASQDYLGKRVALQVPGSSQ